MTGVYPYGTRGGVRWRIAVRRQDGSTTTRRGYTTREAAWRAQERLSGARASAAKPSFGGFWLRWLADKRRYLTDGAIEDLEAHGTKRLLPYLAHRPLAALGEQGIREWMAAMIDKREAGSLAPKTINNARAALSSALADASRRGLVTAIRARRSRRCPHTTVSSTTCGSMRSTATWTPAPRTTGRSRTCSLAPALAYLKRWR